MQRYFATSCLVSPWVLANTDFWCLVSSSPEWQGSMTPVTFFIAIRAAQKIGDQGAMSWLMDIHEWDVRVEQGLLRAGDGSGYWR